MKKIVWWILLIVACIPFCVLLQAGLDDAINGTVGWSGEHISGFSAFKETIGLMLLFMSPLYIVSIITIIISIKKIKNN